ncbi:MAG: tail fiber domain-containing protein [Ferruginibacter sp.]
MMKCILTPLVLFFCLKGTAQNVGVGTETPTNQLHVVAPADPVRIEGLQPGSLDDSVVTVDTAGVLRKRSGAVTISLTGWSVTGNSSTNSNINFIGTTDNQPLVIKTNNQPSGFISPVVTSRNNSIGYGTFSATAAGPGNNVFGYAALPKLTTGARNIALGDSVSFNVLTGSDNIAIGATALFTAASAVSNIAIGSGALRNNLVSENIAIGNKAATGNINGNNILAIGANALSNNKTGSTQLAIGNNALQQADAGLENIAIGYNAALSITNASSNVLVGHYALSTAGGASNNTVLGHNAGLAYSATGNTNNTFIGYQSAISQTGGTGNTYIGANVDLPGGTVISNASALGQGVQLTASNQVRIGNTAVTSIGGQVNWSTFSDARIKKNVREDVPGLAFIQKLRPVTYNYDVGSLQKMQGSRVNMDRTIEATRFTGLFAQEVEAAAKSSGYNFSGVDKPANEQTPYALRYAEFVVPLIKAVQEMKQLIDAQQKEIDALKEQLIKQ